MKKASLAESARIDRLERALLDTFGDDAPPESAKGAAMAALGLGAIIVTAPSAGFAGSTALTAASLAGPGTNAGAALPTIGALLVLKWVGVGIVAGTAALTPAFIVHRDPHAASSRPTVGSSLVRHDSPGGVFVPAPAVNESTSGPTSASPFVVTSLSDGVLGDDTNGTRVAPSRAKPRAESAPTPSSPNLDTASTVEGVLSPQPEPPTAASARPTEKSRLAAELGLLDEARRTLVLGDPADALSLLERYELQFPNGTMKPEAIVLRVEAWMMAGNRAEAAKIAARSVPSLPGRYAERIRALLEK